MRMEVGRFSKNSCWVTHKRLGDRGNMKSKVQNQRREIYTVAAVIY